ncbi:hypothetical protein MFIFM68171_10140 [Madurella fahalii]|uniref:RelA/SpoT domain-containing protein n=1 Tax=Madurella fahalii TaxID=1157608 RepID=A0ABQ0GQC8_9PEZI
MTSTPDSSLCNGKVKRFLEEYRKTETQKLFKDLADATRQKMRGITEEISNMIEVALAPTEVFGPLRVEIQIGTVVTQAWAEVQHNIIYKGPKDIQVTPTMKRMIDAINGLAITIDIMLIKLERSQAQAEKESEDQHEREKRLPQDMLMLACINGDDRMVKRFWKMGLI